MSGHNKWSKIKHKKEASDAKKSKVFTKLVQAIQVESRLAKGDINSPKLRLVIERAKAENMPKENIERAIKKGMSGDGGNLESVLYEVYTSGGATLIIEALTDNTNRTGAQIKSILAKNDLSLSLPGSALWAYEKRNGVWNPKIYTEISAEDKDKLQKVIDELLGQDDVQEIYNNAK